MTDSLEYHGAPVYGRAPRALLRDPSISGNAKALWALLEDHASPESPVPFPGQDLLAEYMGVSRRTIINWCHELVDAGWLVKRRTGRSNRYRLAWKKGADVKPASHRDVQRASHQIGSTLHTKKNQEAEPIEEPLPKSEWSTQEGQPEPVDNSASDGDEYHPPPSGRPMKKGGGWMEEWAKVDLYVRNGGRHYLSRKDWPEITRRAATDVTHEINNCHNDTARIAFGNAYKRRAREYAAKAEARTQPDSGQQRDIPMIGRRI